jgi:hypothetical protein
MQNFLDMAVSTSYWPHTAEPSICRYSPSHWKQFLSLMEAERSWPRALRRLRRLVVGLSQRRIGFSASLVHVGFVVDKVKRTGFSPTSLLRFSSVSILTPIFCIILLSNTDSIKSLLLKELLNIPRKNHNSVQKTPPLGPILSWHNPPLYPV